MTAAEIFKHFLKFRLKNIDYQVTDEELDILVHNLSRDTGFNHDLDHLIANYTDDILA